MIFPTGLVKKTVKQYQFNPDCSGLRYESLYRYRFFHFVLQKYPSQDVELVSCSDLQHGPN